MILSIRNNIEGVAMVFYQVLGGCENRKRFDCGLFHDKIGLIMHTIYTITILSLVQQKTYQSVGFNQPFHNITRDWEVKLPK